MTLSIYGSPKRRNNMVFSKHYLLTMHNGVASGGLVCFLELHGVAPGKGLTGFTQQKRRCRSWGVTIALWTASWVM